LLLKKNRVMSEASLLCLGPAPGLELDILASMAPTIEKNIEQAGDAYQQFLERYYGIHQEDQKEKEEIKEGEIKEDVADDDKYSHKKKIFQAFEDCYGILGLQDKRWLATQDDIRKAYRKMVLEHHPDKTVQRGREEDDAMFKSIQKAWETLSDPKKRRIYDSQEDFDDNIPSADSAKTEDDFYTIFGETFKRFSKFSEKRNVPQLGDKNTLLDKVDEFYNFWRGFRSWRVYDFLDEYDFHEAESREERRWMERRNEKLRKKKESRRKVSCPKISWYLTKISYGLSRRQEEIL